MSIEVLRLSFIHLLFIAFKNVAILDILFQIARRIEKKNEASSNKITGIKYHSKIISDHLTTPQKKDQVKIISLRVALPVTGIFPSRGTIGTC